MPLATVKFGEVSPEKFAKLQEAFTSEFHGGNHTDNSGTVIDHGSTVDYKYDSEKQVLTLNVEKINHFHFRRPSPEEVVDGLKDYVEEVLGELPPDYQEPEENQEEVSGETTEPKIVKVEGSKPETEVNSGAIAGISSTTENAPATKENTSNGIETDGTEATTIEETNSETVNNEEQVATDETGTETTTEEVKPQFVPKTKSTVA